MVAILYRNKRIKATLIGKRTREKLALTIRHHRVCISVYYKKLWVFAVYVRHWVHGFYKVGVLCRRTTKKH